MPETNFFWDPLSDNILQERDETGAVTAEYTTEPGLYGNLISQNRGGVESQYHFDALGSTLAMTDDDQQVTDTYAYMAFGEVIEYSGGTSNPFEYVGQKGYYVDETSRAYEIRRRQYSCVQGRWFSLISDTPGLDNTNVYHYCRNAPLLLVDPSGLDEDFPPPGKLPPLPDLPTDLTKEQRELLLQLINALDAIGNAVLAGQGLAAGLGNLFRGQLPPICRWAAVTLNRATVNVRSNPGNSWLCQGPRAIAATFYGNITARLRPAFPRVFTVQYCPGGTCDLWFCNTKRNRSLTVPITPSLTIPLPITGWGRPTVIMCSYTVSVTVSYNLRHCEGECIEDERRHLEFEPIHGDLIQEQCLIRVYR